MLFIDKNIRFNEFIKEKILILKKSILPTFLFNIMRENSNLMMLVLLLLFITTSCQKEELVVGNISQENEDESSENSIKESITPCDFLLSEIEANSEVVIDCILDLENQVISLPANVNLKYNGGAIINGELKFTNGGIISGELLNEELVISGQSIKLKGDEFVFNPERWGIIEGDVTQEEAASNAQIMNDVLAQAKELNITTFRIDKLDAYFYDDRPWRGGIEIPENFNFEMSDATYLRSFLTAKFKSLILIKDVSNVNVSGGTLIGQRNISGFDPYNGGGNLISISSGKNVLIENVKVIESPQDGMNFFSSNHVSDPEYIPSQNITVRNCTFDSSRRNNLSITDGLDYLIEGCTFLKAGIDMTHSKGTAPRYGIDLEPLQPNQNLERVTIRNCTESGSAAGGIVFAHGKDYLFEYNTFETRVYNTVSKNVRIENNTLGSVIVGADNFIGASENTVISGNTLVGPGNGTKTGIQLYNQDVEVFNNTITNFGVGIQLISLKDAHIYNNIIESDGQQDDGINALFYLDNVLVENNQVKVNDKPYFCSHLNKEGDHSAYSFTFKNNSFESTSYGIFSYSKGLNFIGNTQNSGMAIDGCDNVLIEGNTIRASKTYCIGIGQNNTDNLKIINNVIENEDTNGLGSGIIGEISSTVNKNIEISSNKFSVKGYNRGVKLKGFNGITIKNNSGFTEKRALIDYTGDNAIITNNINLGENPIENVISGINNVVN